MSIHIKNLGLACAAVLSLACLSSPASAVTVDFEELTGLQTFAAACAAITCPQTVVESTTAGNVTLSGGVILRNATNLPADQTTIYGTSAFVGTLTDQLTIDFTNPVTNFLVDVLNGATGTRDLTLSDNAGHTSTFSLAPNTSSGATTIGFAATGTQITLTQSAGSGIPAFDFFVDNLVFNVPIACTGTSCQQVGVPEPATLALVALPVVAYAAGFGRRRR